MTGENRIDASRPSARPAILFVCLGNICRSPLAEAVFRNAAEEAGLDVEIDSAGTGDWNVGKAPDPRAQAIARRNGLDISHMRARQLRSDDFHNYDLILALDTSNLADISAMRPAESRAEVSLLLDLVEGRAGQSVTDPYFGDDAGFETSWADVSEAAQALVKRLKG